MEEETALKKALEEPSGEKKEGTAEEQKEGTQNETSIEITRLYVMNLSYQVTHDELKDQFGQYGDIENIEIPLRKGGGGEA